MNIHEFLFRAEFPFDSLPRSLLFEAPIQTFHHVAGVFVVDKFYVPQFVSDGKYDSFLHLSIGTSLMGTMVRMNVERMNDSVNQIDRNVSRRSSSIRHCGLLASDKQSYHIQYISSSHSLKGS